MAILERSEHINNTFNELDIKLNCPSFLNDILK
jgi:hypothetical protein